MDFDHDDSPPLWHPGQQHCGSSNEQPAGVQTAGCCVQLMNHHTAHPERHHPTTHTHWEGQQEGQKSTLVTDCNHRKGTLTSRQLIAYLAGWDRLNLLEAESHTWRLPAERSEQEFTQINTKIYHDYINSDLMNFSVWSTLRWKLGGRWYGWKPTGPPCCRMAWWAAWRPSLRPGIRLLLRCPGRLFGWFSSSSWSPKRYEWRSLKEINYFTTLFVK